MSIRIYALAKQLQIGSKDLLDICKDLGLEGKGSALASLTDEEVELVKKALRKSSGGKTSGGSGDDEGAVPMQRPSLSIHTGKVPVLKPGKPAKPLGDEKSEDDEKSKTAPAEKSGSVASTVKENDASRRSGNIPESGSPEVASQTGEPVSSGSVVPPEKVLPVSASPELVTGGATASSLRSTKDMSVSPVIPVASGDEVASVPPVISLTPTSSAPGLPGGALPLPPGGTLPLPPMGTPSPTGTPVETASVPPVLPAKAEPADKNDSVDKAKTDVKTEPAAPKTAGLPESQSSDSQPAPSAVDVSAPVDKTLIDKTPVEEKPAETDRPLTAEEPSVGSGTSSSVDVPAVKTPVVLTPAEMTPILTPSDKIEEKPELPKAESVTGKPVKEDKSSSEKTSRPAGTGSGMPSRQPQRQPVQGGSRPGAPGSTDQRDQQRGRRDKSKRKPPLPLRRPDSLRPLHPESSVQDDDEVLKPVRPSFLDDDHKAALEEMKRPPVITPPAPGGRIVNLNQVGSGTKKKKEEIDDSKGSSRSSGKPGPAIHIAPLPEQPVKNAPKTAKKEPAQRPDARFRTTEELIEAARGKTTTENMIQKSRNDRDRAKNKDNRGGTATAGGERRDRDRGGDRPERGDRPDRGPRPDRSDRPRSDRGREDKPRTDRPAWTDRPGAGDRVAPPMDRPDRSDRSDRSERGKSKKTYGSAGPAIENDDFSAAGKKGPGKKTKTRSETDDRGVRKVRTGLGSFDSDEMERMRSRSRSQRQARSQAGKANVSTAAPRKGDIVIEMPCTVKQFAEATGLSAAVVIKKLIELGSLMTINQAMDLETVELLIEAFELKAVVKKERTLEEEFVDAVYEQEDDEADLLPRPPVVTFLGHVDHGKTSLLDKILGLNVVSGEKGGITQHIRAYRINTPQGDVTFVDTPGHEAFTAMRARGAMCTDIAVLVVAADDGVMPQTEEAISHAKAAGVPIVVALNKMDLPGVNREKVIQELAANDLMPSEWGGDVEIVETSAATGMGIEELVQTLLMIAELRELKANPNRPATGVALESSMEQGQGVVCKALVQNGTLRPGDIVLCGDAYGRVKALSDTLDDRRHLEEAGPSTPISLLGLNVAPGAGSKFTVLNDISAARQIAEERTRKMHETELADVGTHVTLENLFERISVEKTQQTLNIIIRADVRGSIEAIRKELGKLEHPEVKVKILQASVGGITEADVHLADASDAIIVGFSVVPDEGARVLAEKTKVQIRRYDIIYKLTEDIKAALEGMLKPVEQVKELGRAVVKRTFSISRVGTIAGCRVMSGVVERDCRVRLIRDSRVIGEYVLETLKREKDDAKEVREGYECGIKLKNYNDIKENDVFEAFKIEEIARTF